MGAGEHEREATVGNRLALRRLEVFGDEGKGCCGRLGVAPPAAGVDQLSPRRRDEPAFRVRGNALLRPGRERGGEGVGERILRRRHVAFARGEKGDELAVALARRALGGRARLTARIGRAGARRGACHIAQTGRTSTAPVAAPGQRAAQAIAASRSAASIR
jgi:hypothetical protein